MIESDDFLDPVHGIPVFSLYGEVRRPTREMMDCFDVLLVDLQDLGCRIYTFITTLRYVLEAAAACEKPVMCWIGPIRRDGRSKGLTLRPGLGEFCRRRPDADASRPDAGRTGRLVRRTLEPGRRVRCGRHGGLAARRGARLRLAGANVPGSTPAPTRQTSGWRAAMPAP